MASELVRCCQSITRALRPSTVHCSSRPPFVQIKLPVLPVEVLARGGFAPEMHRVAARVGYLRQLFQEDLALLFGQDREDLGLECHCNPADLEKLLFTGGQGTDTARPAVVFV